MGSVAFRIGAVVLGAVVWECVCFSVCCQWWGRRRLQLPDESFYVRTPWADPSVSLSIYVRGPTVILSSSLSLRFSFHNRFLISSFVSSSSSFFPHWFLFSFLLSLLFCLKLFPCVFSCSHLSLTASSFFSTLFFLLFVSFFSSSFTVTHYFTAIFTISFTLLYLKPALSPMFWFTLSFLSVPPSFYFMLLPDAVFTSPTSSLVPSVSYLLWTL